MDKVVGGCWEIKLDQKLETIKFRALKNRRKNLPLMC